VSSLDEFLLKLRRGEGPFFKSLGDVARFLMRPSAPRIPAFLKPFFRAAYELHFGLITFFRTAITVLYRHPLLQGRCASMGKNVSLDGLPYIEGHAQIHIGNDVWLGGKLTIVSGRFLDSPQLVIGDGAEIGWNSMISVNREVVIEEHARISYDCRISDSDGHRREADLRLADAPLTARDIRAVKIGKNAWIGNGSHIMKGVTIGEGAIIGANSVVIGDIPPFSLAMGNPAEVYFQNFGRASKRKPAPEDVT
jgi:acetyltransferase-like isoleucine patch superfamily enzyme